MPLRAEVEQSLDLCYDAIAMPERWASALDRLAHSMGASGCIILPHDVSDRDFGQVRSTNMAKLHELWVKNLDWVTPVYEPRGDPYVRSGHQSVIQSQLFSEDEIKKSRFHQEIARPAGTLEWASGIFSAGGRYWCMPFFRSTEPFAPDVLSPLAEISRRVAQIVSISEKITRSSAQYEVLTLERAGCAAVLIDRHGRVSHVNRRAEELFGPEFGIRNGKLWTAASASLARLDRFQTELKYSKFNGGPLPAPIVIARSGTPWLMIEAMPVTAASMEIFDGCRAILTLTNLAHPLSADEAILGLAFGLTKAEARLAAFICEGQDLNSAAAAFNVSPLTVRSQLKPIFAKTGTRRQAELVARIAQIRNIARH